MRPEFSLSSPRAPRRSAPRRHTLRKRCSPRPILTAPEKFLRGQAHGFARLRSGTRALGGHPSPLRTPRSVSRLLGVAPIVPATTGRVWPAVRPSLSCQSAATTPLVRVHAAATTRRILHLSSQRSERGANGVRVATGIRLWGLGSSGERVPHFPSPALPCARPPDTGDARVPCMNHLNPSRSLEQNRKESSVTRPVTRRSVLQGRPVRSGRRRSAPRLIPNRDCGPAIR